MPDWIGLSHRFTRADAERVNDQVAAPVPEATNSSRKSVVRGARAQAYVLSGFGFPDGSG
ncbi:hypothetical protein CCO02nite_03370 [Cellulomonas composti]|uniref:Uncharacterized protein n=1 Tax=Cellulomonas composti TaxID=266130 RepID=A0A511J7J2_9CELL|nr:hypothetical protein CCO02nite_03370 [Cellulomonas composti]